MSDNIRQLKKLCQSGFTIVELLVVIGVSSMIIIVFMTVSVYVYGDALRASTHAQLATESQTILRSVVEELRQSSSIRTSNANPDDHAPAEGWNTSNDDLILIISTPALDSDNNFIINTDTGNPYQNEIIYFAAENNLYRRILANQSAAGNTAKTTCPTAITDCPADVLMSTHFKDMNFVFYDQDDAVTNSIPAARSIKLLIQMERKTYGKTMTFNNDIRITIRNTYP